MNLITYRSNIILILQKSRVSKDSRINERHIEYLIHKYRGVGIRQDYKRNREIDPSWLLSTGRIKFSLVNSAEDLPYATQSMMLGKYVLPTEPISLPDDLGLFRVSSSSRKEHYHMISVGSFFGIPHGSDFAKNNYCFRIGNAIYTYPAAEEGNIDFIPHDPMKVPVLQTDIPSELVVGEQYNIIDGNITHAGTTYYTNQSFTATSEEYTGEGEIRAVRKTRLRTIYDYYPMNEAISDYVDTMIYSKEFALEPKEIADLKNDNADQQTIDTQKNK